ncbi:MAG: hypothetical protein L0Y71_09290 [Gemmataceae bacterium]|nr:hypothetical protein [Gemmataceae bacterium]
MRRQVRWLVLLLPLALVGCANDPREARINSAIGFLERAASDIRQIKENVADSIKKADNKKLASAPLKEAVTAVESLRNLAKEMQKVKQDIESLAGATPQDRREELAQQFRGKLTAAMASIDEERRALEKTMLEAEAIEPEALRELRSKLSEAEGSFVMLARPR